MERPNETYPVERPIAVLFCPQCGEDVPRPEIWKQAMCGSCGNSYYTWDLSVSRRLSRHILPVFLLWGVCPGLLLVTGLLMPVTGPGSETASLGSVFTNLALHGGPAVLYAWSAFLLRHRRVRWWWLLAFPHCAVMAVLNLLLAVFLLPLVADLVR